MKDFKELQTLIDKYYKSYDDKGNEIDDKVSEYYEEIENELDYLFNWQSKLDAITTEIEFLRKQLKTHTHSEGTVYVKL